MNWLDPTDPGDIALLDDVWPDSASLPAETLAHYLDAAQLSCAAYAPTPPVSGIPAAWRQAQAQQARDIARAAHTGQQGQIGPDGLSVMLFPMDLSTKALLRPRRGRPVIA